MVSRAVSRASAAGVIALALALVFGLAPHARILAPADEGMPEASGIEAQDARSDTAGRDCGSHPAVDASGESDAAERQALPSEDALQVQDDASGGATDGALPSETSDAASLADGTYTVSVSLRNADNLSASSMASSAIDGTDRLSVEGGSCTLGLALGAVQVGSVTGRVSQVDVFPDYSVADGRLSTSGAATPVWTAKSDGDGGPAAVPVTDAARADGYLALQLHSAQMPVSPQKAALFIDWSTLERVSDVPEHFDSDATGAKDAAATAAESSSPEVAAAAPAAQAAGEPFQVGRLYSVPISIRNASTGATSMASAYFGGYAYVRPLANGTFDVRFTTNRPDYISSMAYDGAPADVTFESDSAREYRIYVARSLSDATVRLNMHVVPMAADVSADLVLHLAQAVDQGGDAGQVASATDSVPATGDALPAGALGLAALTAAGACALARRELMKGRR